MGILKLNSLIKYYTCILFICIISSCAPEKESENISPPQTGSPTTYNPKPETMLSQTEEVRVISEQKKNNIKPSRYFTAKVPSDTGEVKQVQYTLRESVIDSLNKIIPLFDTGMYNLKAVNYFTSLSEQLHGKSYFANNSDELITDILEILTSRLEEGTDIVFLIDKTGSMDDDIDKVQQSMKIILSYLKKYNNVRLGIASYGDKNWHYDLWYNYVDLTADVGEVENFLTTFNTIGNPDVPESVNDAIVETLANMNWKKDNKRLILLIGDAPSQVPPFSSYTTDDVIKKCDSMDIKLNLYPIVLAVSQEAKTDVPTKSDFANVFPIPANNYLNIKVKSEEQLWYTVFDMSGRQVINGSFNQRDHMIDLSNLSNGNYLVQILNLDASHFYTKMVPVTH